MADDGSGQFLHIQDGVLYLSEDLTILELTAEQLKTLTNRSRGILYVWAPWKPVCWGTVRDHLKSTFGAEENVVLVSSNYDLPNLVKSLNGLVDTAYVLSHRSFGQDETEKLKALSMNLIGEEIDDVPQTYFFDHGTVQRVRDSH